MSFQRIEINVSHAGQHVLLLVEGIQLKTFLKEVTCTPVFNIALTSHGLTHQLDEPRDVGKPHPEFLNTLRVAQNRIDFTLSNFAPFVPSSRFPRGQRKPADGDLAIA